MKDVEPLVPATKSCICFAPLGAHQHDVHIAKGILGVLQHEGLTSWPVEIPAGKSMFCVTSWHLSIGFLCEPAHHADNVPVFLMTF